MLDVVGEMETFTWASSRTGAVITPPPTNLSFIVRMLALNSFFIKSANKERQRREANGIKVLFV